MYGQWIGEYEGTNHGLIMIDIDDRGGYLKGTAVLLDSTVLPDSNKLPGSFVEFSTKDCGDQHTLENLGILPLDSNNGNFVDPDMLVTDYADRGMNLIYPKSAKATLRLINSTLEVEWTTDIGTSGKARLPRSLAESQSSLVPSPEVKNWGGFKHYAASLERDRYIFRGQPGTWRLRTAFHRTDRKDLFRFMREDIPRLHKVLSGQTKHYFNLDDSKQNGSFWNLVQHHGYPTPLLDWTHSPFVAAFFAFRNKRPENDRAAVRIFMFDSKAWCEDFPPLDKIAPAHPHFSILEPLALENPRSVPQQALSSVTNVDDIETFLSKREIEKEKTYLTAFDLPGVEADKVLNELVMMGISAGALFPGLDGVCEELRYRMFGY